VYDGNGLDPDITVEDEYLGAVTVALIQNGLIFEFASKYCGEQPNPPDLKSFKLSDVDYNKFLEWIKTQKFSYATALESSTSQLMEAARQERYYSELETQLNDLRKKIEANKASDLIRFKKEISEIMEQQIAFHYALAEGQAAVSLHNDRTVSQAVKTLNDKIQYKSLLSPP
jgi:carboxyl-terminal processing protease